MTPSVSASEVAGVPLLDVDRRRIERDIGINGIISTIGVLVVAGLSRVYISE